MEVWVGLSKQNVAPVSCVNAGVLIKGEDMHHGYYPNADFKDHKAAQVAMIDRSLEWAYGKDTADRSENQGAMKRALGKVKSFIDVGCGVGGSSRHIYQRYAPRSATAVGISLSPYQVQRANELTQAAGLSSAVKYQVADALNMPFRDKSFDLGKYRRVSPRPPFSPG
jgi:tocopherol O-methyltransferase